MPAYTPTLDWPSRDNDRDTAKAAAVGDRAHLEHAVLDAVRVCGTATTDDVWHRLCDVGMTVRPNSVARRLTTLSRKGLVVEAGTRPGDSGRQQTAWRCV